MPPSVARENSWRCCWCRHQKRNACCWDSEFHCFCRCYSESASRVICTRFPIVYNTPRNESVCWIYWFHATCLSVGSYLVQTTTGIPRYFVCDVLLPELISSGWKISIAKIAEIFNIFSVDFPHKDYWRGALMFSLIYAWKNGWTDNRDAGDLRRHHVHYDVTVTSK